MRLEYNNLGKAKNRKKKPAIQLRITGSKSIWVITNIIVANS